MSKDQDNEFMDSEDLNENQNSHKDNQPWNRKFNEDENLKNRQYSRTARNQPVKEATTLSKVLLGLVVLTVLTPFILYMVVDAQRNNDDFTTRTAENITVSKNQKNQESKQETTEAENKNEKTTEEPTSVERESIESVSETEEITTQMTTVESIPPAPTPPPAPEPEPEPEPTGGYYTVNAGDSWFAIARAHGVDVYQLAAANNASIDTPIFPGDSIVIP